MYQFPEDLKEAYESCPLSFVYYQNIEGDAVPVLASGGFCRNTGVDRANVLDWLKNDLFERIHPDDAEAVKQISDDFLNHRGSYDIIFRSQIRSIESDPRHESDKGKYVQIHGIGKWQTMRDGTELAVISYSNLSSSQKAIREKMEVYSLLRRDHFYTDPLTGFPNINYLHEFGDDKISLILKEGKTPYLIYTDINSMQFYNTQYGFKEGDKLLCVAAETMKKLFPDALVARGADDHIITVTGLDESDDLESILRKANNIIRKSAVGNTTGTRSGVSSLVKGLTLTEALDQAKYALKLIDNNMNRIVSFFSQDSNKLYLHERYIVENFNHALEKKQIKVYYHALYRVETRRVAAFEGLSRWVDPERGIFSPKDFVPVLLKYHQLYKLDLFVFEQVCIEVKSRHENGLPLVPVSVNFSMQDFDYVDVVGEMNRLFDKYDLVKLVDKSYFIVEITEQDLALGAEKLREQLKQIRDNGYRLWLDDFGSGYSAINVFSQYEFDLVKYDMNFLSHLDDDRGINRVILQELVALSRKFGIQALIEGVETEEQIEFVKEIGCGLAQGYYFHRPESLDDIIVRIRDGDRVKDCESPEERAEFHRKWIS